jgi:RNA polymerase sigma-70 factor, ECF subfamily
VKSDFPDDSEELLARVAEKDQAAFGLVYDRYANSLFGIAIAMTGSHTDAEEVLQNAFVAIWNKASHFDRRRGAAGAWMAQVTRNQAIDSIRKRQRLSDLQRRYSDEPTTQRDFADAPTGLLVTAETAHRVRSALASLPGELRRVLDLAFFEGCSQSEIADILKEPLGTIKSRARRAMDRMRSALGDNQPAL